MSNLINKVKSSMHRDSDTHNNSGYDNPRSSNEGPHSSNVMNKADPRVDSDMDHRNNPTSHAGGYGQTQRTADYGSNPGTTGATGGYSNPNTVGSGYNTGSTNAGPHNSNLANKVDPRVDSDLSNTRKPVPSNHSSNSGGYGSTGPGAGYDESRGTHNAPVHNSNVANKLDPRVDTVPATAAKTDDHTTHQTNRGTMEHDTKHTGAGHGTSNIQNTTGTGADKMVHSTKHEGGGTYDSAATYRSGAHTDASRTHHSGPGLHESSTTTGHSSSGHTTSTTHTSTHTSGGVGHHDNFGSNDPGFNNNNNKNIRQNEPAYNTRSNDPGYSGNSNTPGTGRAQNTAGPHDSDMLNKLDPRVDSDQSKRRAY